MNKEEPRLNTESNSWDDEFAIVICRFLEDKLTGQEFADLQERLRSDEAAREQFTTIAQQQNFIREGNPRSSISETRVEVSALAKSLGIGSGTDYLKASTSLGTGTAGGLPGNRLFSMVAISAAFAALLFGGWLWFGADSWGTDDDVAVAKVSATVGSDVFQQIEQRSDSKLFAGDMVCFGSGAVEIEFPDRATVVLTGPAKLRIDSAERATLLFGRLAAKVSELGKGFIIETPDAEVTDLGTEFSIAVTEKGATDVKVTSGLIDVAPIKQNADKTRLATGEARRVSSRGTIAALKDSHLAFAGIVESLDQPDLRIVSEKDTFLMGGRWADKPMQNFSARNSIAKIASKNDLLVKYDIVFTRFNRIAVIGFDLSNVSREQLLGARLRLSVAPNDLAKEKGGEGHTYVPNRKWQFIVEGAWDRGEKEWTEESLTWNNAPGVDPDSVSGELLGQGSPMKLGEFAIVGQGQAGEQVVIDGKQLVDFLKLDNDGKVTLLIRRQTGTIQAGTHDITVHGFAGRENEELDPPTLELWMSE